jgi:aromatic ring-opening dioxygenase catalytic subunit (LigB family)
LHRVNAFSSFYGFPSHYYEEKFPHRGSRPLAEKVISLLTNAGIKAKGVSRGLDHGVWASFKCAFDPVKNPLNIPIVQVSLYSSDDPDKHYQLGSALSSLREEGIQIIVSGMAVHNLRDMFLASSGDGKPLPYTTSFDEALKSAVEGDADGRKDRMRELLKRPDARQAHPSFEHLLPVHIGAGAAGEDTGKQLWTRLEGSMSWAQYRFGEVQAAV